MPKGLTNAPAPFNLLVATFPPPSDCTHMYFKDNFVYSRAEQVWSDVDNHIDHLRAGSRVYVHE